MAWCVRVSVNFKVRVVEVMPETVGVVGFVGYLLVRSHGLFFFGQW